MRILTFLFLSLILMAGCNKEKSSIDLMETIDYEIINIYPHETSYFTQGFEFVGDTLVEGTGLFNNSVLVKYNYRNSEVYKKISLPAEYFGEGITVFNDKIYWLTWKNRICFVFKYSDLSKINEFTYLEEGWGLTNDGANLIMSDGTDRIYFRDPFDFNIIKILSVKDSNNTAIYNLNELEYAEDKIYANIWQENYIVSIDPITGFVLQKYYMSDLLTTDEYNQADFLNGIAYKNGNFFVTGKNWPKIFEIILSNE